jgi:hypothetical protein
MMGDDHGRIAAASKLAAKQIGCKVFKGSPYYRKEGAHAHGSPPPARNGNGNVQAEVHSIMGRRCLIVSKADHTAEEQVLRAAHCVQHLPDHSIRSSSETSVKSDSCCRDV